MRRMILALVAVIAVASSAVVAAVAALGAVASTSTGGTPLLHERLPGVAKLNRKAITGGSPAHSGVKNVYASRGRVGSKFPNGTVVVKTIAKPGDRPSTPTQVAVMRKVKGAWRYVEHERSGSRYAPLDLPQSLCSGCHAQARASDYVFTKR